jgi:transmembrane sensor
MNSSRNHTGSESMSAHDAAAFWLVQRDRGIVLQDDSRFTAWLAASQSHLQAWNNAVALWESFENNTDPLLEAMRQDALAARRRPGQALYLGAIAAIIAITMIAGVVSWRIYGAKLTSEEITQLVPSDAKPNFVSAATSPATFALPDGSLVTLDANAALAVRYDAQHRAVRLLRGQAYFHIVHDSARPFTADAGGSVISDLGTDFNILMNDRSLSVTLINGSVAVATQGAIARTLQPGQKLQTAPGQAYRITAVDLASVVAWRTGYIEFHDEPLEKTIAQINQYGGAPARITDPLIRDMRVSGRFRSGDPARFARALAEIYPLRITSRPDGGVDITRR